MAGSTKHKHRYSLMHLRDQLVLPPRTPGILGSNDAADPNHFSLLGDTPGPTGVNDHGVPDRLTLPGLGTLHNWAKEAQNHVDPTMQVGHYYPPGKQDEVLEQAYAFILKHECPNSKPPLNPCVPGEKSGVTIGVGYDIGQTTEKKFRADWAELDQRPQPPKLPSNVFDLPSLRGGGLPDAKSLPSLMPAESKLFTAVDRLAFAAKMSHAKSEEYLEKVIDINIPADLSLKVFKESTLPEFYEKTAATFSGFDQLPTGVQVAVLDLVYNRGTGMTGKSTAGDVLDPRWEMRELKNAIRLKDLVWVYFYFESMRRVWAAKEGDKDAGGLVQRRDDELALIFPYVIDDIKHEAILQQGWFK